VDARDDARLPLGDCRLLAELLPYDVELASAPPNTTNWSALDSMNGNGELAVLLGISDFRVVDGDSIRQGVGEHEGELE
jgi:hypothetical protein